MGSSGGISSSMAASMACMIASKSFSRLSMSFGISSNSVIIACVPSGILPSPIGTNLQTAVYWQMIPDNPAKRVKPPKGKTMPKKQNYFDDEQAIVFLDSIEDAPLKYKVLIHIAVYGGLRLEEVLPLTWNDFDFNNYTVDINKALSYVDGEQFIKDTTKNAGSTRRITLPTHIFDLLEEYRPHAGLSRIFDMHYSTPGHWLKKTIARHNKCNGEKLPMISFHGLRHTNATLLISQGIDPRTVSGRLGHRNVSTTLNIYSHYIKSKDVVASEALSVLLRSNKA